MGSDWADEIFTTVTVRLGWRDRLKALLNGRVYVRVEVKTEHEVGRTHSTSSAWTPPLWTSRRPQGFGESEDENVRQRDSDHGE